MIAYMLYIVTVIVGIILYIPKTVQTETYLKYKNSKPFNVVHILIKNINLLSYRANIVK